VNRKPLLSFGLTAHPARQRNNSSGKSQVKVQKNSRVQSFTLNPFLLDLKICAPWLLKQESFKFFISLFASKLKQSAEVSFYFGEKHLEITLKDEGKSFYQAISKFIPPEQIKIYEGILKFIPDSPALLKVNFKPAGHYQTSLYFPIPLSLEALHHWLKTWNLKALNLSWFKGLNQIVKHKAIYPGFDFEPGKEIEPGLFYILVRKAEIQALNLNKVLAYFNLGSALPEALNTHNVLLPHTHALYLSTNLCEPHSLKLDYENIPVVAALRLLPQSQLLQRLAAKLKFDSLYYLGIKYSPLCPPAYKIYLKLQYVELDPLEAFADALSRTVWI
jgi:hypothetical protein